MNFASRKAQIEAIREGFAKRFLPLPCDSVGSPFPIDTARTLTKQIIARQQQHLLSANPTFFTTAEAAKLIGSVASSPSASASNCNNKNTGCGGATAGLTHQQQSNNSSGGAIAPTTNHQRPEEQLERVMHQHVFDILCKSETTVYNISSVHGASKIAALLPQSSSSSFSGGGGGDSHRGSSSSHSADNHSNYHHHQQQHRVYHRGRWCLAGKGDVARSQTWRSMMIGAAPSSSCSADENSNNKKGTAAETAAHNKNKSHQQQQQQQRVFTTTAVQQCDDGSNNNQFNYTLWFSHESILPELEHLYQSDRHHNNDNNNFTARMWVSPNSLPKNIAANGNRLTVHYALPRKLLPASVIEPRVAFQNRSRIMRPFHFWARTGLRVTLDEEEEEEEDHRGGERRPPLSAAQSTTPSSSSSSVSVAENNNNNNKESGESSPPSSTTIITPPSSHPHPPHAPTSKSQQQQAQHLLRRYNNLPYMAWFSAADLKLFGYKSTEDPLVQFLETRLLSCVPLCAPYLSEESLQSLNAMDLPQAPPPSASSPSSKTEPSANQTAGGGSCYIRLLRSDFRWTKFPLRRVQLPRNEDDARAVCEMPLADQAALSALGVRVPANRPPLVLTLKIPVAAYNVMQLVPVAAEVGLPPPWM